MNKRHYEHTLPNIRGSLSNTYEEKKNTDYCLCHRKQDSREFIMIHGCLVIISCLKKVTGDK